jgi:general secretion pathway protein G
MTRRQSGFTLIELLVVFAIIATLLSLVAPRYFQSIDRSKEAALQENLATLRQALDKYQDDTGKYPGSLEDLVNARYLRKVPLDPITESVDTWVLVSPPDARKGGVFNVKSGAAGNSASGKPYGDF